jgi:hypothetical protein
MLATLYTSRAIAQNDRAGQDFDQAIQLDPQFSQADRTMPSMSEMAAHCLLSRHRERMPGSYPLETQGHTGTCPRAVYPNVHEEYEVLLGRVLINRARLDVRSHSNSGARADIVWLRRWAKSEVAVDRELAWGAPTPLPYYLAKAIKKARHCGPQRSPFQGND